jgi:hypothetical protein
MNQALYQLGLRILGEVHSSNVRALELVTLLSGIAARYALVASNNDEGQALQIVNAATHNAFERLRREAS